ncbi:uncharacterized protein TNCV_1396271 [Trichonephila clavipes]|nr:uncharacterized protein TNCV_1396271 [Trichonephila clavipes]
MRFVASSPRMAAVAEWSGYRIVAGLVTSSSPVPLETRRVGEQCTLNLSRAPTSSRWCGVVARKGGTSSVVTVTNLWPALSFHGGYGSPVVKVSDNGSRNPTSTIRIRNQRVEKDYTKCQARSEQFPITNAGEDRHVACLALQDHTTSTRTLNQEVCLFTASILTNNAMSS